MKKKNKPHRSRTDKDALRDLIRHAELAEGLETIAAEEARQADANAPKHLNLQSTYDTSVNVGSRQRPHARVL